ncbi:hypothetical protein QCA50_007904 [Cerrena zonata]|uniref:Uncharacterized protein n=1 Tax=Cerrena zonata TaxID=2478898 RepID=A0AAW0G6C0_9APHY
MVVHTPRTLSRRLDRIEPDRRLVRSRKRRSDLHVPRINVRRSLTFAERSLRKTAWDKARSDQKADLQAARDEIHSIAAMFAEKYGHCEEYWYSRIMQSERLAKTKRRINLWNVFLSLRLRQINLGQGTKKKANDPDVLAQLTQEWLAMSQEA